MQCMFIKVKICSYQVRPEPHSPSTAAELHKTLSLPLENAFFCNYFAEQDGKEARAFLLLCESLPFLFVLLVNGRASVKSSPILPSSTLLMHP